MTPQSVLLLLAFLSPGAWLITYLPPVPIAKALSLFTVAVWAIAVGAGVVASTRLDRRLLLGLVAVLAAVAVSWVGAGDLFVTFFYDMYAEMPLLQWLAFIVVFTLAARMVFDEGEVAASLQILVIVAALLSTIVAYQYLTTGTIRVFGSPAYSTTALIPFIPVAVALASRAAGLMRVVMYIAAVIIGVGAGVFSGSMMGLLAAAFAGALAVAIHPAVSRGAGIPFRVLRGAMLAAAFLLVAVLVLAQIPAISARVVDFHAFAGGDRNMLSRVFMWQGAQDMFLDRPLAGFGPSGYRVAAVEYLPPEAFQHVPDAPGSIDPTVYSPQSPHSILWEVATRLGLLGLAAFFSLFALWVLVLRDRLRTTGSEATLRLGLAAAFCSALFALLVSPVFFAIGLFAPVAAGLAVASRMGPGSEDAKRKSASAPTGLGVASIGLGVFMAVAALWLGYNETRLAMFYSSDPRQTLAFLEETLEAMPGHPAVRRQALEMRLLTARDDAEHLLARQAVDRAPAHISAFAPNLVSLVTFSLAQARATGRTDLSWETALLDQAQARIPPTPALVAERLHLAVLSGDPDRVWAALPEAQRWGSYYPFIDDYLARAEVVVGQPLR